MKTTRVSSGKRAFEPRCPLGWDYRQIGRGAFFNRWFCDAWRDSAVRDLCAREFGRWSHHRIEQIAESQFAIGEFIFDDAFQSICGLSSFSSSRQIVNGSIDPSIPLTSKYTNAYKSAGMK